MNSKRCNHRKRHNPYIILFNSYLYTVKSVYRKRKKDGVQVFIKFLESDLKICFNISNESIDAYNFLKKGQLITVHLGNGGYCSIQEGNHMPENSESYSMKI